MNMKVLIMSMNIWPCFNKLLQNLICAKLLSEEENENNHIDWYEPRVMNFSYFLEEAETWKKEQSTQ